MHFPKKRLMLTMVSVAMLSACAFPDPPRDYVGVSEDAKITFKSSGMPMAVGFSIGTSDKLCEGYESVGYVRDAGEGVLLPGIVRLAAKFNRTPTKREARVPTDKEAQIKAYASWNDGVTSGRCGPLITKFPVQKSGDYVVEFVYHGTSACALRVLDRSNPAQVKPVEGLGHACPTPLF